MLPAFDSNGNLPEGIHAVGEDDFMALFGVATARREWLSRKLREIVRLAKDTAKLERAFVWGSFVTAKEAPNDVDVLLVMRDDFALVQIGEPNRAVARLGVLC